MKVVVVPSISGSDAIDRPLCLPMMLQEPAQVWAINPLLLQIHVCETLLSFAGY